MLCGLLGLAAFGGLAAAAEVNASASVDRQRVALGEAVELRVEISGTQQADAPTVDVDGCAVQYLGPSTYISVVNGRVESSITHIYSLLPTQEGRLTIGPITVHADGRALQTQPLAVEVLPAASRASAAVAPDEAAPDDRPAVGDALRLTLGVDATTVYQNQALPIKLQLLVGGIAVRGIEMPTLQADGFLVKPLGRPAQSDVTINGQPFTLLEFDTTATPTRPGALRLGPATMHCQVVAPRKRPRPRRPASSQDPFADFFNQGAFFDDFFNQAQVFPMQVTAEPVAVEVRPWPTEDRPADFRGAVGRFSLDVQAVPQQVAVGEPVTVTMTVRGEGNLETVTAPPLVGDTAHFKVYEPQPRKAVAGAETQKVFEQVLIPLDASVREVPAVRLSCLDPATGRYQTITQPALPLRVTPAPAQERATVVESRPAGGASLRQPEALGRDIVYIKEDMGLLHPPARPWYAIPWWWVWCGGPALAVGVSEWLRRLRAARAANPAAVRSSGAFKRAWAQAQSARRLLREGKIGDGYAALFRALQRYIGDRFNLPAEGLTKSELERVLRTRGAPDDVLRALPALVDRCDTVRFAPVSSATEQAEATVQSAEGLLTRLDQWKPK